MTPAVSEPADIALMPTISSYTPQRLTSGNERNHPIQNLLEHALRAAKITCFHDRDLIPLDAIQSTLRPEIVSQVLTEIFPDLSNDDILPIASSTCGYSDKQVPSEADPIALRVLALLILCGKTQHFIEFFEKGINDSYLPLKLSWGQNGTLEIVSDHGRTISLSELSESDARLLERLQRDVSSPFFSPTMRAGRDIEVLPFKTWDLFENFNNWPSRGFAGYGEDHNRNWRVQIHHSHQDFSASSQENQYYLLTQIDDRSDRAVFSSRIHRVRQASSDHIYQVLDWFKYLGHDHTLSVLPFGSLGQIWAMIPEPALTRTILFWVSGQWEGLIRALESVDFEVTVSPETILSAKMYSHYQCRFTPTAGMYSGGGASIRKCGHSDASLWKP
uniref:Uncharacterized protein n=1 Tax=Bionectria ochroleuca TaxID=29856 RepID=A0A0B7KSB2_BIOOC